MSQILQKIAPIGESRDQTILKDAVSYVYSSHEGVDLIAHVFLPEGQSQDLRPAILYFHGGFWDAPLAAQFVPHCHHFAARGMVSISFEYRVASKHQTGPMEAIEDSRAALNWVVELAAELGIDTEKVIFSGAAGGAHLALLLTMQKEKQYSAPIRPKALLLYSALVNTTPKGQLSERFPSPKLAKQLSPSNLLRRKLPPMLFLHGKADRLTLMSEIVSFCRRMRWRGNHCRLFDFIGAEHSFFNFNVNHSTFEVVISASDRFLVDRGFLPEQEPEF
jgi:acetyl esterase/lipase